MTQRMEDNTETNLFRQELVTALNNFKDPTWLGNHSPLATPYFLGEYLLQQRGENSTAVRRGQTLQKLLRETAQTLVEQEEDGLYLYRLLDLTFFRPRPLSQILHELSISKSTFYRPAHRPRAIQQLEQALIRQLKPTLRLEEAPAPLPEMLGRETAVAQCQQLLEKGHTLAITGSSGMGKTSLGACLVNQWRPQPIFWFTLRPGLNDQLGSFLFLLGFFLQRQGAASLWLQMVADAGKVSSEIALGLIRRDLTVLGAARPLLSIDEVDLLRPSEVEAHKQLLTFFSSLRGLMPILLLGQQVPLEADWVEVITGLNTKAIRQMLAQAAIELSAGELATLQAYTDGNPRLLKLFITLHRAGEPLADVLPRMSTAPSLEFIFNRIWQHLDEKAQNLLAFLAVFRRAMPRDAWPEPAVLDHLAALNLVQIDETGGSHLLPAFKAVIYHLLSPETREAYHLQAAVIRAIHSQYTAAAYHYIHGGQPETAVWLWYTHRRQEIDQGQGPAALELFVSLSRNQLPKPEQELLVLLRSELRLLVGTYDEIRTDLYATLWQNPILKGRASRIEGDVAYEHNHFEAAIQAYRQGLETISSVSTELALFHKDISKTYWQKQDPEEAWQEALLARYEVENLQGDLQETRGNYPAAHQHYEQALSLAKQLGFIEGEGKTRNNLAWMLLRQGKFELATQQWEQASHCYQQVGRLTWQAGIKINQAVACTDTGQPERALPLLQESLAVFESLAHTRGKALAMHNLAEAHFALDDVAQAEHFIWQAIQHEDVSLTPANLKMLARIRLAQGQLEEAEAFGHKSLEAAEQNQNMYIRGYAWRILGQIYLAQGQEKQALAALGKAIAIFEELDLPHEIESTRAIGQQQSEKT